MRWLAVALLAAAVFALPASAASVDPRVFVLHQADVPAHYLLDEDNSMGFDFSRPLPGLDDDARRLVSRFGFVNGYVARYLNSAPPRWRYIDSVAFVFRRAEGAKTYLAWMDRSLRAQGGPAIRRTPLALGAAGWMYTSRSRETGTQILWRYGRVVASLTCQQMTRHRTLALALARKQQRQIVAALR
jgi:hypothetical protein